MSSRHAGTGNDAPVPRFGHTRHGHLPVHLHARDHLPSRNAADRFNSRLAVLATKAVGSMWCAYLFAAFDCLALPTAIRQGMYGIVQWTASFFLQLVLLSVILVGQNLQASASDARAAKTFEDAEAIKGLLDTGTPGGLADVMEKLAALESLSAHASAIRGQAASARADASAARSSAEAAHAGVQALADMITTIPQAAPHPPSTVQPAAGGGNAGGEPAPAARRSPTEPRERM